MKKLTFAMALAGLALPTAASAQMPTGIVPCQDHWAGSIGALSLGENFENVRRFYNGRVTLMQLDTEEPAAASFGYAIQMPSGDGSNEPAFLQCFLNWGFTYVDVAAAQSSYDPARGLTLTIPTRSYDVEQGGSAPGEPIRLLINIAEGTITELD